MFLLSKTGCLGWCILFVSSCRPLMGLQSSTSAQTFRTAGISVDTAILYRNEIPIKAVREMMSLSGSIDGIRWQKVTNGWLAKYTVPGSATRVNFDSDGSWTEICSSFEKTPEYILSMINNGFRGYRVTSVCGILFPSDNRNMLFSIVITKSGNCKLVKVFKNEMTVISDFDNPLVNE